MRRCNWGKGLSFFFTLVYAFLIFPPSTAYASDIVDIEVEVTFHQTEARSVVNLINEMRSGEDAWAWDKNNIDKNWYNDRGPIKYDYNLEQIAMQRAAEASIYFSHTRPNGSAWYTCKFNETTMRTETLGEGQDSASYIFFSWCEKNSDYSGQGHRRAMLENDYVGISYVTINGYHVWAAAYSNNCSNAPETVAVDGVMKKRVSVDVDFLGKNNRRLVFETKDDSFSKVFTWKGESVELPETVFYRYYSPSKNEKMWKENIDKFILPKENYSVSWEIKDTNIAEIVNGRIIGKTEGETWLRATTIYQGEECINECRVIVGEHDLAKAKVAIYIWDNNSHTTTYIDNTFSDNPDPPIQPIPDYNYTGSPITFEVIVSAYASSFFRENVHYAVQFENNLNPGIASVRIIGIGEYYGQREYRFRIVQKEPTPKPTLTPTKVPTRSPTPTPAPTRSATPTNKPTVTVTMSPSPLQTPIPTEKTEITPVPTDVQSITEAITPEISEEPTQEPSPTEEVVITLVPIMTATPVLSPEMRVTPTPESNTTVSPSILEEQVTPTGGESETNLPMSKGTSFGWIYALILIGLVVLILLIILI